MAYKKTLIIDGKRYHQSYRPGLMFGASSKVHAKQDAKVWRKRLGKSARVVKRYHGYLVYIRSRRK